MSIFLQLLALGLFEQFGVNPSAFFLQLLICLPLPIWATYRCFRSGVSGWQLPFWLLFIWCCPFVGAVCALLSFRYLSRLRSPAPPA